MHFMWFLFSVLSAVFLGVSHLLSKKLVKLNSGIVLASATSIVTSIMLLPYIFVTGFPHFGNNFLFSFVVTAVINTTTTILVFRALKSTDVSLAIPLFSLSPVFLLVTSPFLLGEFPTLLGLFGVLVILLGAYFLNFDGKLNLQPFREIFKNRGQRIVLLVCFLWSISTNFYKIGMQNSSPMFFTFAISFFIAIVLIPFINIKKINKTKINVNLILLLGLFSGLSSIFEWLAVDQNLVVYVLSIKRLSLLITVTGAYIFFNEKNTFTRIIASIIMLVGVTLIAY